MFNMQQPQETKQPNTNNRDTDHYLAELTQHYRDEAAKIAAQIKKSFGM
jgi:Holliday junction resolvase RusA-like endonuclease